MERDRVMERLRAARPSAMDRAPDPVLFDAIAGGRAPLRHRRRTRHVLVTLTATAAAAIVASLVAVDGSTPDMRLVAAVSQEVMDGTGRAFVDYAITTKGEGVDNHEEGTNAVTFSGDDLDMVGDRAGDGSRPVPWSFHNRTVDGEFFLEERTPDGGRRWIHDVAASGITREDLFNLDPRTLLGVLDRSSDFETVSTDDGVSHLRTTSVSGSYDLNFGAGPDRASGQDIERLDVWVGPDDVVRRMTVVFAVHGTWEHSGAKAKLVEHEDGTVTKEIDPEFPGETIAVTMTSTYNVRFFDLGEDITIEAPPDPTRVAGKG